jgi:hypothetical protein
VSARFRIGAVLALALAAGPAAAQTKVGTTIGQFTMIPPGARFAGMGNAGAAMMEGLQAVYANPAALGQVKAWQLQFSHAAWLAGIRYDYAAAAFPVKTWGAAYASVTSLGSGDIDVRTVGQPLGTGERFHVSDVAIGLGFGREISSRFAAGGQVTWIQETIWNSSASAATFSLGSVYRVSPNGLHIGSSLQNFGTSASFDGRDLRVTWDQDPNRYGDNGTLPAEQFTDDYPVPILFRVGLAYPFKFANDFQAWTALDAWHPSDNTESVSGGAEVAWKQMVSLRLGYQNLFLDDSEVGLTLGAGFAGKANNFGYRVDYAWADHQRLDGTHRVTVGVGF